MAAPVAHNSGRLAAEKLDTALTGPALSGGCSAC